MDIQISTMHFSDACKIANVFADEALRRIFFFLYRLPSPSRRRSYSTKVTSTGPLRQPLPYSRAKLRRYAVTLFDLMNFKIMSQPAAYKIRTSIFAGEQSLRDDEFRVCVRIVVYKCKYFLENQTQDGRCMRKILPTAFHEVN